jgi:hypothetical protein
MVLRAAILASTVVLAALSAAVPVATAADYDDSYDGGLDGSRWSHNGSVMYLRAQGSTRRIYYLTPRPGMLEAGARRDSLLFDGNTHGGHWSGSAYVFSGRCKQKYPYLVDGRIRDDGTVIQLVGRAPHIADDCTVDRYGTSNDVLIFSAIENRE